MSEQVVIDATKIHPIRVALESRRFLGTLTWVPAAVVAFLAPQFALPALIVAGVTGGVTALIGQVRGTVKAVASK